MEFARTVTTTYRARWIAPTFTSMTPMFRTIRAGSRVKMDRCFRCEHPFADGELMALAAFDAIGNRTLCQRCASELLASAPSTGADTPGDNKPQHPAKDVALAAEPAANE